MKLLSDVINRSLSAVRFRNIRVTAGVVWGGAGWGGIITFMFQYTHRHGNRQWSFIISYCWGGVCGGVGWDNNVHVPVTGTATGSGLSSSVTAGVGWGGVG